jgi:hypothetical protein
MIKLNYRLIGKTALLLSTAGSYAAGWWTEMLKENG